MRPTVEIGETWRKQQRNLTRLEGVAPRNADGLAKRQRTYRRGLGKMLNRPTDWTKQDEEDLQCNFAIRPALVGSFAA
jgi:hypothetical protein